MFKTIVWATDGSESANHALPYARAMAEGADARLVVVHIKEVFIGRAGGYPVLADEEDLEAEIRQRVEQLKDEGVDVSFRLVRGVEAHAAHMIAETAREEKADLVVVGTRGHAPIAGLLLGSVTQRLLHIAPCPILAIPAGAQASDEQWDAPEMTASA